MPNHLDLSMAEQGVRVYGDSSCMNKIFLDLKAPDPINWPYQQGGTVEDENQSLRVLIGWRTLVCEFVWLVLVLVV